MENISTKNIIKLLYISLIVLCLFIIFAVAKYIGLIAFFSVIIKAFIPAFIAFFISILMEPLINIFIRLNVKRRYGVILSYFFVCLIIFFVLYISIPSLTSQVEDFTNNIPTLLDGIRGFLLRFNINVSDNINEGVNDLLLSFSNKIVSFVRTSLPMLFNFLLGVSGAIFLSFDFLKVKENVKKAIPERIKKPVLYYLRNFLPFVNKYFNSLLIDSVFIFVISIIGFKIIGVDNVIVISLFIAITNLIPYIGPYIGGVPAVIIGFTSSITLGISALIVVIVVQLVESNIVQPLILKNAISLHPFEGIIGISVFGALFGAIGMILSPILVVAVKLLYMPYREKA